jgi:hypothetical protein
VVEHGEGKIVDVGRDPEPEHQHEKRGAEQAESEADRIAREFERLPDRVGEEAPKAEGGVCRLRPR